MSIPILSTKLYIPPRQPNVVLRPRLCEMLNDGLLSKLTLISAPAGFGKTTLVSEWASRSKLPTAWLNMDKWDSNPMSFLNYLVAALQTVSKNIGKGLSDAHQSQQSPPIESILSVLLNEITTVGEQFTIVIDDYHVIDARAVDKALTFLIEHLPPQVHLIVTTREDPHLPMPRLRARGQLTELRAADLRFTTSETADYINDAMGLNIPTEEIDALETRTEGWIAGLQLAAISMKGRKDTTGFIKSFTGNHHFIMDYLVEEVLQNQSEGLKAFLLRTSILNTMCGSLCDAVMGDPSPCGQENLEYIERANLFIVPLDNERRWYRYHHLFADLLRQRLRLAAAAQGDKGYQLSELHLRASRWYEENDMEMEAIDHAFAAEDLDRAANLVELTWAQMHQTYRSDTLIDWLQALPEDMVRSRPVLCIGYAWALLDKGKAEGVESLLRDAEQRLDATPEMGAPSKVSSTQMIVFDEKQFHSLPASIADARATRAMMLGDLSDTLKYARLALDIVPEEDHFRRGAITGTLGIAYYTCGDLDEAYRHLKECQADLQLAGNIHLASALTPFEHALALAEPEGYVRIFLDEGPPMVRLLSEAAACAIMPEYTRILLNLLDIEKKQKTDSIISSPTPTQPLIEPLSGRELEVLQLVAQGLSNREIGERLFLALDTVKGHNRNIFGKLQVKRRTEAVARARDIGLL